MLNVRTVFILQICLMLVFMCSNDGQNSNAEKEYEISSGLEGQNPESNINYDSLLIVLDDMAESISEKPENIELRKSLASAAYDSSSNLILAAGRGQRLQNARTPTIAMRYAEKAATIKAYRLAANIKTWIIDPAHMDSNKNSMQLPAGRIVSKNILPDSTVQVLVEVNVADIR